MTTKNRHRGADAEPGVRCSLPFSKWLAIFLCTAILGTTACAEQWTYTDIRRVVALSDVHGAYDALVETLQAAEVIDEGLAWRGGDTHLVITGDLLDRGPDSRNVMDLVMRLESEAMLVGGRVHQLLGNHEIMNLIGDLRYVADEEFASYVDLESSDEREYWFQHYLQNHPGDVDESTARDRFDLLAPPGYFGHQRAFRPDGTYGKWLLDKPIAVVINETLFVHGGVPSMFSEIGLAVTNSSLKKDLRLYVDARTTLEDAGKLSPTIGFKSVPDYVQEALESSRFEVGSENVAEQILTLSDSPLHGPAGPTWYRGSALCSSIIEADRLQDALRSVGATRVVLGHTPTVAREVRKRLNGKVIRIDTGMLNSHYDGLGHALVIEDGEFKVVNQRGDKATGVVNLLPQVGFESSSTSEAELEVALAGARIKSVSAVGPNWKIVSIDDSGRTLYARFRTSTSVDGFLPEVAAYRLDRLLGLEMVPVTVQREIAGESGSLQFVPIDALNEMERVTSNGGEKAHCRLDRQYGAMHVFDALINNNSRSPSSMLYQSGEWRLILTDHDESFGVGYDALNQNFPKELNIGNQWRQVLTALDIGTMRSKLGDVLTDGQIEALVERGRRLQVLAKQMSTTNVSH